MKKNIILPVILVLTSCTAPLQFQVSRTGEEGITSYQKVVYSLPRTVLKLSVEIEKESYIPGPYYQFTERLLGLSDYIKNYGISYRITNVGLESFSEPDPESYYTLSIQKGDFMWEKYFRLNEMGFLLQPGYDLDIHASEKYGEIQGSARFPDMATTMNLREIQDTLYKTIITDTSLIRLPVVTTAREVRTLEQKAEEAAGNLFTIRENRFFLISNTEGDYPDGKALEVMVREMDKMEKAYLELFTGKVIRQKYRKDFIYVPESTTGSQVFSLGVFSAQTGLKDSGSGRPLQLEIMPMNNFKNFDGVTEYDEKGERIPNQLFYRLPDLAEVNIKLENDLLHQSRIKLFQSGGLVGIPVKE